MKITTQAIADLAGVSRATVDKVIHNRPGVSDAVREKDQGNHYRDQLSARSPQKIHAGRKETDTNCSYYSGTAG